MARSNGVTRREFVQTTTLAAIGAPFASRAADAQGTAKSTVVLIRDRSVLDASNTIRADVLASMLDRAVTTLVGISDASEAWRSLIKPSDVVGIKSNRWRSLPTPPALEQAIQQRVISAGVPAANVSVDDQGVLRNPVFQRATALINSRPMRTHDWSGVGTLLKNYIMFAPSPPDYHPDSCADLAALWSLPAVKGKTRLNVLVLLTPQFHGVGPHSYNSQFVWPYCGLAVGIDPVAVDSVGLRIIEARRREYFGDDRPLNPPAKHIRLAETRHHLGFADPARVDLKMLGERAGLLLA
jgi:hypothetical protein